MAGNKLQPPTVYFPSLLFFFGHSYIIYASISSICNNSLTEFFVHQVDDTEVISFLLSTEIIPLCLRTMEMGSELSKTVEFTGF